MKSKIFLILLAIALLIGLPNQLIQGAGDDISGAPLPNIIGCEQLDCVVNIIIDGLLIFAIPIVAIMITIGGIQMLTAAGSPDRLKRAKQTIAYAAIGYAVLLLAKGIFLVVADVLGGFKGS